MGFFDADYEPDREAISHNGHVAVTEEPAPQEQQEDEPKRAYRLMTVDEVASMQPPRALIRGLINTNSIIMLTAPPGSFKTYTALSMACAVASPGMSSWEGYPVVEHGLVWYVAAEGATDIPRRMRAWCEANNQDYDAVKQNLILTPDPTQLGNPVHVNQMFEDVLNLMPTMIVLDTKHRVTSGLKENDSTEQGQAFDTLDALRKQTEAAIMLLHHTTKDGLGQRGSSAWEGNVDLDLRMFKSDEDEHQFHILCQKRKSEPDGCKHFFEAKPFENELVIIAANPEMDEVTVGGSIDRKIMSVVTECDLGTGLSLSEIVGIAGERGVARGAAYSSLSRLKRGAYLSGGDAAREKFRKLRDLPLEDQ